MIFSLYQYYKHLAYINSFSLLNFNKHLEFLKNNLFNANPSPCNIKKLYIKRDGLFIRAISAIQY